jgi:NtrC-family two-component system sensor histidine kinase KinB
LEQARLRFAEGAEQKGIELLVEMQGPLPHLQADQPQLDRVLDNLIDNALRHTARGGLIRLQARRHGERVIISVEDNGEGIAYGSRADFRALRAGGRKKAEPGSAWRVQGNRAAAWWADGVYSRPGQGTQFYMALAV